MKVDKIKELVVNSELSQLEKNIFNGFIDRSIMNLSKLIEDKQLIETVADEKNISEVILSTDEVKIYTVNGKDDWDVKYPFRGIYLSKRGVWERTITVSPTLDIAFLNYLQYKHLKSNSQFVDFALKMLEINHTH